MNLTDITGFGKATWIYQIGSEADIELTTTQQDLVARVEQCELVLIRGVKDGTDIIVGDTGPIKDAGDGIHRFSGTYLENYYREIHGPAIPLIDHDAEHSANFFFFEGKPYVRPTGGGFKIRVRMSLAVNIRPGDIVRTGTHNKFFLQVQRVERYKKKNLTFSENYIWLHCVLPTWVKLQ